MNGLLEIALMEIKPSGTGLKKLIKQHKESDGILVGTKIYELYDKGSYVLIRQEQNYVGSDLATDICELYNLGAVCIFEWDSQEVYINEDVKGTFFDTRYIAIDQYDYDTGILELGDRCSDAPGQNITECLEYIIRNTYDENEKAKATTLRGVSNDNFKLEEALNAIGYKVIPYAYSF